MKPNHPRLIPFVAVLLVAGSVRLAVAQTSEGSTAPQAAVTSDPAKSAQDHLALATSYDSRVQELDRLVADHEQMKRDQRRFYTVNPKVATKTPVAEMDKHCDAIIRDTKKLQADLRDFAAWHRARAAELERK